MTVSPEDISALAQRMTAASGLAVRRAEEVHSWPKGHHLAAAAARTLLAQARRLETTPNALWRSTGSELGLVHAYDGHPADYPIASAIDDIEAEWDVLRSRSLPNESRKPGASLRRLPVPRLSPTRVTGSFATPRKPGGREVTDTLELVEEDLVRLAGFADQTATLAKRFATAHGAWPDGQHVTGSAARLLDFYSEQWRRLNPSSIRRPIQGTSLRQGASHFDWDLGEARVRDDLVDFDRAWKTLQRRAFAIQGRTPVDVTIRTLNGWRSRVTL